MILTLQERRFVVYALHFLASNLDEGNLEDLGPVEPATVSDNQVDQDHRAEQLCTDLRKLAAKVETQ